MLIHFAIPESLQSPQQQRCLTQAQWEYEICPYHDCSLSFFIWFSLQILMHSCIAIVWAASNIEFYAHDLLFFKRSCASSVLVILYHCTKYSWNWCNLSHFNVDDERVNAMKKSMESRREKWELARFDVVGLRESKFLNDMNCNYANILQTIQNNDANSVAWASKRFEDLRIKWESLVINEKDTFGQVNFKLLTSINRTEKRLVFPKAWCWESECFVSVPWWESD